MESLVQNSALLLSDDGFVLVLVVFIFDSKDHDNGKDVLDDDLLLLVHEVLPRLLASSYINVSVLIVNCCVACLVFGRVGGNTQRSGFYASCGEREREREREVYSRSWFLSNKDTKLSI